MDGGHTSSALGAMAGYGQGEWGRGSLGGTGATAATTHGGCPMSTMGTTSGIGTGQGIMSGGKGRSCTRAAKVLHKGFKVLHKGFLQVGEVLHKGFKEQVAHMRK